MEVDREKSKFKELESDYAGLRTSTHSEINTLKKERDDLNFQLNHNPPTQPLESKQKTTNDLPEIPDNAQRTKALQKNLKILQTKSEKKSIVIKKLRLEIKRLNKLLKKRKKKK